jgi:hypothetical protein
MTFMGRSRLALLGVLALACVAAMALALRDWAAPGLAEVRGVPSGHQEIAWISPATSGEAWERLVAALTLLQQDKSNGALGKNLRVQLANAFLPLTADVPEVALFFDDAPEVKLWIRWYKLSGQNPSGSWFDKLIKRGTSPLAIIGGETSDRALYQARALAKVRSQWPGPAPLYLISTATAERYYPGAYPSGEVPYQDWPRLMDVYKKRTYRFCFPNTRIVEAVLDFVHQNPQVCAQRLTSPQLAAAVIAPTDPYTSLASLSAAGHFQPYYPSTLIWKDDGYSKDLGEIFLKVFADEAHPKGEPFADFYNNYIHYSVGDFLEPNPQEALAVGLFLAHNPRFRDQPQLLALPTAAQRARRFLRTLCRRAPTEVRNVVVVTGDAIAFNNVYRDRDVAWNILDMPVPLVFFSPRNPIDAAAGFGQQQADGLLNQTGTQDVLLNRDVVESLVQAAFDGARLVADADRLQSRLEHTRWRKGRIHNDLVEADNPPAVPFFDEAGNRRADTGEHIVWVRPVFDGQRNLPEAFITVWRAGGERPERSWRTIARPLHILYDQPTREESDVHGGD